MKGLLAILFASLLLIMDLPNINNNTKLTMANGTQASEKAMMEILDNMAKWNKTLNSPLDICDLTDNSTVTIKAKPPLESSQKVVPGKVNSSNICNISALNTTAICIACYLNNVVPGLYEVHEIWQKLKEFSQNFVDLPKIDNISALNIKAAKQLICSLQKIVPSLSELHGIWQPIMHHILDRLINLDLRMILTAVVIGVGSCCVAAFAGIKTYTVCALLFYVMIIALQDMFDDKNWLAQMIPFIVLDIKCLALYIVPVLRKAPQQAEEKEKKIFSTYDHAASVGYFTQTFASALKNAVYYQDHFHSTSQGGEADTSITTQKAEKKRKNNNFSPFDNAESVDYFSQTFESALKNGVYFQDVSDSKCGAEKADTTEATQHNRYDHAASVEYFSSTFESVLHNAISIQDLSGSKHKAEKEDPAEATQYSSYAASVENSSCTFDSASKNDDYFQDVNNSASDAEKADTSKSTQDSTYDHAATVEFISRSYESAYKNAVTFQDLDDSTSNAERADSSVATQVGTYDHAATVEFISQSYRSALKRTVKFRNLIDSTSETDKADDSVTPLKAKNKKNKKIIFYYNCFSTKITQQSTARRWFY